MSSFTGQTAGHYRLLRCLGEGGMGVVYEAVRTDIGTRAALKILRSEYARHPDAAARFFNEACAVNVIGHPGIVRIFDYGHLASGEPFLAMEFLEGESLRGRLQRQRRLPLPDTLRIGRQLAASLVAAHEKQILHRDLKPENVMIIPDADAHGGERTKLLDFGIAKLTKSRGVVGTAQVKTQENALLGTPIYMSPEQCRGIPEVDDRTDVYSLGVMLFEMLTGRPPFLAETAGELIGRHIFMPAPSLREFAPSLNPRLHRLIDSTLSKDAAARPTMRFIEQQLKFQAQLPDEPAPPPVRTEAPTQVLPVVNGERPKEEEDPTLQSVRRPGARAALADEAPRLSEEPSEWQAVEIIPMPLAWAKKEQPPTPVKPKSAPKSRLRLLRRARFRVRAAVYAWLGLAPSPQAAHPAVLQTMYRRRRAFLTISIAVLVALLMAWLLISTAQAAVFVRNGRGFS